MPTIAFTVFGPEDGLFVSYLHRSEDLAYTAAHRGELHAPAELDDVACVSLLERIFADGNEMGEGRALFTVGGRSMSVGDVVTLAGAGTWICDSMGWRRVSAEEAERFAIAAETAPARVVDPEQFFRDYDFFDGLPNGLAAYVHHSNIGPESDLPADVAVAGTCMITGTFYVLEHVPVAGLSAWLDGAYIQDAPHASRARVHQERDPARGDRRAVAFPARRGAAMRRARARSGPGGHVLIPRGPDPGPDDVLLEASALAELIEVLSLYRHGLREGVTDRQRTERAGALLDRFGPWADRRRAVATTSVADAA